VAGTVLRNKQPCLAKAVVYLVAKTAHDLEVVGSNPVVGIPDGSGVKATQV